MEALGATAVLDRIVFDVPALLSRSLGSQDDTVSSYVQSSAQKPRFLQHELIDDPSLVVSLFLRL